LSSVTAIDQQAIMTQKRKQDDAGMQPPVSGCRTCNQWFWGCTQYQQCNVCNSWGHVGQDGLMHKVHTGGGIFQDQYICAKCWDDPWIKVMGKIVKKTDNESDDDMDDEDDEKAGPSKKKSKGIDAMKIDG